MDEQVFLINSRLFILKLKLQDLKTRTVECAQELQNIGVNFDSVSSYQQNQINTVLERWRIVKLDIAQAVEEYLDLVRQEIELPLMSSPKWIATHPPK